MWTAAMARAAHDLGLAAWSGGALMGAVGLNAATREVEDHTQRLRVADAGWFRWAPITALAMGAHLVGTLGLMRSAGAATPDPLERGLAAARTALTLAGVVATAETGRQGRRVVSAGDVPVATAVESISDTPAEVARAQRVLRWVQWAVPALTASLWAVNAVQVERGHRDLLLVGPMRRWLA